jgi:tripartite-type tricarboxylate transporter receptor subunit TctC
MERYAKVNRAPAFGCSERFPMRTSTPRRALVGILPALLCASVPLAAQAQAYPARAVRIIIPVAPGGATDILTRTLAARLATVWRQQVFADNRPGGGSNVAFEAVAKATADGYTILMAQPPLAVNASLYRKLAYDALRDFDPVVLVATSTNVLVSHPSVPVRSVEELIALAKRRPGQLTYASSGNGTTPHLSGELFKHVAGIDLVHIPYKGAGPAINDLLGGHVALAFVTLTSVAPHIRANRLRALALTSAKRSALMPELRTFYEAGWREIDVSGWYGIVSPAGTPREAIARLNADVAAALTHPEVAQALTRFGLEPVAPNSPEDFAAFIRSEISRWAEVVRISGARAD